jgi:hypothetical protein
MLLITPNLDSGEAVARVETRLWYVDPADLPWPKLKSLLFHFWTKLDGLSARWTSERRRCR